MKFIMFILYMVLGFWLLGQIGSWALRRWVRKQQAELEKNGGNPSGRFYRTYTWGGGAGRQQEPKPEGDVTVTRVQTSEKTVHRTIGDYVEYEDVETETIDIETTGK